MKFNFTVIEEQDTTVAIAVGAFLDCEHYAHLHRSIMAGFEILKHQDRKIWALQKLRFMGLTLSQEIVLEYIPPGHFRTYDIKPSPWWIPSIHHFVKTVVDVRYTPHPERNTTLMQFDVEMDIPFWLYPFRHLLRRILEKIHHLKDKEDLDMIRRRAKLFGRENNSAYLVSHQLLLHKDDYVKHFATSQNK